MAVFAGMARRNIQCTRSWFTHSAMCSRDELATLPLAGVGNRPFVRVPQWCDLTFCSAAPQTWCVNELRHLRPTSYAAGNNSRSARNGTLTGSPNKIPQVESWHFNKKVVLSRRVSLYV